MALNSPVAIQTVSLLNRVYLDQYTKPMKKSKQKLICKPESCQHQEVFQIKLLFRERWGQLHHSLKDFWKSDFQVSLSIEICPELNLQSDDDVKAKLKQAFSLPRSCLFPLNNAYVGLNDVTNGIKFVISNQDEVRKLKPFLQEYDYLMFVQNLDLLQKRCTVGLLFPSGDNVVGVLIEDGYTFIMDGSDVGKFVDQYISYGTNKFSSETFKNLDSLCCSDKRLFQTGARESRFNLLRFEILRETIKQMKKPASAILPSKVYKVMITQYQKSIDPDRDSMLNWVCHCLPELTLGQVLLWYQHHCGPNVEQFKFEYGFPFSGDVKPSTIVSQCKEISTDGIINIIAMPPANGLMYIYTSCLADVYIVERFDIVRLSVDVKLSITYTQLRQEHLFLLVSISDPIYEIVRKAVPCVPLNEMIVIFDQEPHVVVVPLCVSLGNLKHIYGKPTDGVYRISILQKKNEFWIDKKRTTTLKVNRPRFLMDQIGGRDYHFKICFDNQHRLIWHGQITCMYKQNPFTNMLLFTCGDPPAKLFGEKTKVLEAYQMEQQTKTVFFNELFGHGQRIEVVWAPKVDTLRMHDGFILTQDVTVNHIVMALKGRSSDNFRFAFLVNLERRMFVYFPTDQDAAEKLMSSDFSYRVQKRSMKKLTASSNLLKCDNLNVICPIQFKFSNQKPLAKATEPGLEGLMLMYFDPSVPAAPLSILKHEEFFELYVCPELINSKIVDVICKTDRRFIVRFETRTDQDVIFEKNLNHCIATTLTLETEEKDLPNQMILILKLNEDQTVTGHLPDIQTQKDLLDKLWNLRPESPDSSDPDSSEADTSSDESSDENDPANDDDKNGGSNKNDKDKNESNENGQDKNESNKNDRDESNKNDQDESNKKYEDPSNVNNKDLSKEKDDENESNERDVQCSDESDENESNERDGQCSDDSDENESNETDDEWPNESDDQYSEASDENESNETDDEWSNENDDRYLDDSDENESNESNVECSNEPDAFIGNVGNHPDNEQEVTRTSHAPIPFESGIMELNRADLKHQEISKTENLPQTVTRAENPKSNLVKSEANFPVEFDKETRLRHLQLLEDALEESKVGQQTHLSKPVINKCYLCNKPAKSDSLICSLCNTGTFCDKICFERARQSHKTSCIQYQVKTNRNFLEMISTQKNRF